MQTHIYACWLPVDDFTTFGILYTWYLHFDSSSCTVTSIDFYGKRKSNPKRSLTQINTDVIRFQCTKKCKKKFKDERSQPNHDTCTVIALFQQQYLMCLECTQKSVVIKNIHVWRENSRSWRAPLWFITCCRTAAGPKYSVQLHVLQANSLQVNATQATVSSLESP